MARSVTRRVPSYTPKVELIGDWKKTRALLFDLPLLVKQGTAAGQKSAAEKLLKIIKKNIRDNGGSIGWPPVSELYAKKKIGMGKDPNNLLVLTGLYYRSINIYNKGTNYYVGIKKNTRNYETGGRLTVAQIATILEYGSYANNIKARPLWGPSFKQFGGSKKIKSLITWHIARNIYARHKVRTKITF